MFFVLLLVELVQLARAKPLGESIVQAATLDHPLAKSLRPCDTCAKEDIHLIITDEYAGATELKEVVGFDNAPFISALRERGFHINEETVSNYNSTVISMASLFSMSYLGELSRMPGNEMDVTAKLIINDNLFVRFLKKNGYGINNISIFDVDGTPASNNRYNPPAVVLLTGQTFLSRLADDLGFHLYTTWKWQPAIARQRRAVKKAASKNLEMMDSTVIKIKASSSHRPQFYYTHLLMPHKPYYFVKQGKVVGTPLLFPSGKLGEKEAYLEYLQFTNRKILSLIDSIISLSPRPPVIILMSDHGLRDKKAEPEYHFMNLNAVLFPDRRYDGFYKGISNVNQLRVVLNSRFNQNLPLLPDSTIFLEWEGLEGH